jgi:riboflavin kinase/FMN adenylyltransferase
MRMIMGVDALAPIEPGAAVSIGTFDGLHLGHRALIARAVERARAEGLAAVVVTWDRHPVATLRPGHAPPLLTSLQRKIELFESLGVDVVAVLAFDTELSSWPPERFASEVLASGLMARAVIVGQGWRFGHKAAGDVATLTRLGDELGFDVDALDLVAAGGGTVSSSRIRAVVAAGDVELAAALLGRRFDVDGVVVRGAARGAALGYPTANVEVDPVLVQPARGAYAGRARGPSGWYPAAISVGVQPTFGGDPASSPVMIEAYLLDFHGNLYGRQLRIEFWKRLHDDVKFDSVDDLVAQIEADVRATRALAGQRGSVEI